MSDDNKENLGQAQEQIDLAQGKVDQAKTDLANATSTADKKKIGKALGGAKKELAAAKKDHSALLSPKLAKFKTLTKGKFILPGIEFFPGKSTPVPEDIQALKKFKHAVKLGVLVKG